MSRKHDIRPPLEWEASVKVSVEQAHAAALTIAEVASRTGHLPDLPDLLAMLGIAPRGEQ